MLCLWYLTSEQSTKLYLNPGINARVSTTESLWFLTKGILSGIDKCS